MFSNISWHSYWTVLAILCLFYYATILFIYYRKDLRTWLLKKSLPAGVPAHKQVSTVTSNDYPVQQRLFEQEQDADFEEPPTDSKEYPVYACMDELSAFFEEAKSRRWQKGQLVQALQVILAKYPSIKDPEYKSSLGQVIQAQCEQYCSIHLKADEVVALWL